MRRLLILFVMLCFSLPCFAAYKPIPADKSKQYKTEVESIINKEVPKAKQEVYKIYVEAQRNYINRNIDELNDAGSAIGSPEFHLYLKIINLTNTYVYIQNDIPATDYEGELYDFLYPYFVDNKIDLTKLNELINLCGIKQKEIGEMVKSLSVD